MAHGPLPAPRLRPGDQERLVSPASYPDTALADDCLRVLESWDLRGEVAPHAFDRWGYMAGSDAARLGCIHGCLVGPTATASVRRLLVTTNPITLHSVPDRCRPMWRSRARHGAS